MLRKRGPAKGAPEVIREGNDGIVWLVRDILYKLTHVSRKPGDMEGSLPLMCVPRLWEF